MPQCLQAIEAALNSDWEKAVKINLAILKENASDIDALNRLGYAYLNTGNPKKAKSALEKVLKLDPFNPIASKNLKKVKDNPYKGQDPCQSISPKIFLEEPGITKTVNLVHLAAKPILSSLHSGQQIDLISKKNRIEIRNGNTYLGALPDDLSFKMRKLIKLGNSYCAFIKAVDEECLTVIVREVKRGKRVKDASFLVKLVPDYHTSIRSELVVELLEDESVASPAEPKESEEE